MSYTRKSQTNLLRLKLVGVCLTGFIDLIEIMMMTSSKYGQTK